jgi:hypothetical protein
MPVTWSVCIWRAVKLFIGHYAGHVEYLYMAGGEALYRRHIKVAALCQPNNKVSVVLCSEIQSCRVP